MKRKSENCRGVASKDAALLALGRKFEENFRRYKQVRDPYLRCYAKLIEEVERRTGIDSMAVTDLRVAEDFVDAARPIAVEQGFRSLESEMTSIVTALGRITSDIIVFNAETDRGIEIKARAVEYHCEDLWECPVEDLPPAERAVRDLVDTICGRSGST